VKQATFNLNRIIDINFYPVDEAKRSNFRHRPIGLGVQGLADVFILMVRPPAPTHTHAHTRMRVSAHICACAHTQAYALRARRPTAAGEGGCVSCHLSAP
jgi:hypothetical protein